MTSAAQEPCLILQNSSHYAGYGGLFNVVVIDRDGANKLAIPNYMRSLVIILKIQNK